MQVNAQHNTHSSPKGAAMTGFKEDNALALRRLLHQLAANWYWFLIFIILGLAVAWTCLRYAMTTYNINAKIVVENDRKGGGDPGYDAYGQPQLFGGTSNVDYEVEILSSRSLMEKVVRDLQLNITYWTKGKIKTMEHFGNMPFYLRWITREDSLSAVNYKIEIIGDDKFVLSGKDVRKEAAWGDTVHLPEGALYFGRNDAYPFGNREYLIQVLSIDQTVSAYQKILNVSIPNKQVGAIALSLTSTIPQKGEKILNKLIETYLQANVDAKNRMADSTIGFVDKRLELVGRELTAVEENIQHFKESNGLADLKMQAQLLVSGTGEITKQLTDQEVRLSVVEAISQYIKDEKNSQHVVPSLLLVQDPNFTAMIGKYNVLQLDRERLLMTTTDTNPLIKSIDLQLVNLRKDIQQNLASMEQGITVSINELQQKYNSLSGEIRKVPAKERIFNDYSRQQAIKQELYMFLLKKREESAISKSSSLGNTRIIDGAKSEVMPFKPNGMLVLLLGVVGGVAIPSLWLYLKSLLNTRLLHREDITGDTPVPVLGEIGHIDTKELIVIKKNVVTPVVEQFRSLRTHLRFVLSGPQQKTVLITSSMNGEGKSFVAANLAALLALSGKKVVLVELDLRKPKISEMLNVGMDTGFSTYAIGQTSLEDVIRPSGICENYYIVPCGPIPPDPTELLLLDEVEILFARLRKQFDYIIIDTAPIGMVTDALLLAHWADATLYLVRHGYTFKRQLEISKNLYLQKKVPKLNLIINDTRTQRNYGYGYAYGYGYGNGYSYNDVVKNSITPHI